MLQNAVHRNGFENMHWLLFYEKVIYKTCSNPSKCTLYIAATTSSLHVHCISECINCSSSRQCNITSTKHKKTQLTASILPSCETQPGFSILMVTRIKQKFITTLRQSFQLCPPPYWIVSWLILLGASLAHTCIQITAAAVDSCGYTTETRHDLIVKTARRKESLFVWK